MSVRNQAAGIKEKTKKIQKKNRKIEAKQKCVEPKESMKKMDDEKWFEKWAQEVIENWKCVVANISYLKKKMNPSMN